MRVFVGIDPGLTGAMAVIDETGLRHLVDLPVMERSPTGTVRNQINPAALKAYLSEMLHPYDKNEVLFLIEGMQSMPAMMSGKVVRGVATTLSIGLSAGLIEGVVAARGYAYELVQPAHWKKVMKVSAKKETARAAAIRMYPEADLHKVGHHNRAEAVLIARWGQMTRA